MDERSVVIVGDGPTGLSAALILAKNKFTVHVVGLDESPVHKAMLHNYLGEDIGGPEFLVKARIQAERFGARLQKAKVERIDSGEVFKLHGADGTPEGNFLVLATGFAATLAGQIGIEMSPDGVKIDLNGRTSKDRVYAGGAAARGKKSQVATSVGDGAAIAVDIMSRLAGKPTHDYDVLPK
jgi:thioredoxin reductase (NADPH)